MANIKMSAMAADTVVDGTEKLLALDGVTSKTLTTAKMAEYANDVLVAAAEATPTTGDDLLAVRAGVEKRLDLDATVTYAVAGMWTGAAAVSPVLTGDLFLMNRTGTTGKATIDTITTYVLTTAQATVLNLSGLTTATLAGTDLFAVCQTTTGKKVTLTELETKLWADFKTYATGLTDVATAADADELYCIQGGVAKKLTLDDLGVYMLAEIGPAVTGDVWDDAAVVTTVATGDIFVMERTGDRKSVDAQYIASYVNTDQMGKAAVTPAADGDKVAMWRSTTPGTMTVDVIATYTKAAILDDFTTRTTALDTDTFLFNRSSAGNQITAANLATYVLDGVQADVLNFTGLATATLGATDLFAVSQTGVGKSATLTALETKLWTDFATYTGALTDAVTVTAPDKFYMLNGATPQHATGLEIATYVTSTLWAAAGAAPVTTNSILIHDGTGTKKATVDQLATFVLTGAKSTILDVSALTVASGVAGTDTMLICQGALPYYITLANVGVEVLKTLPAHTTALAAVATPADADLLYCLQGGVAKKLALSDLATYAVSSAAELPWEAIGSAKYTQAPSSTSVLLMSDTSDMAVGLPLKYTIGGVSYYGIVTAISANVSITIAGAPLSASVTALYVGLPSMVVQREFFVDTAFGDAVQDILADVMYRRVRWDLGKAYLVAFSATLGVADTGAAQPKINVKAGANLVSTADTNKGLQVSATPGTWTDSSAVAISTTNYAVDRNEAIDIRCTEAGTNGDADCLSVNILFVLE